MDEPLKPSYSYINFYSFTFFVAQKTFKSESDKWRAVRACVPLVPA